MKYEPDCFSVTKKFLPLLPNVYLQQTATRYHHPENEANVCVFYETIVPY